MNQRERVLTALRHQEPDRVPIDAGGTDVSAIMAVPYVQLRKSLGLGPGTVRVADPYQMIATMEEDVRRSLGGDTIFAFHEPREWRQGTLTDGSPAEFPARFLPVLQEDGSQVVFNEAGETILKMPQDGFYFDPVHSPLADVRQAEDIGKHLESIETYDTPAYLDKSYEELAEVARELYEQTDYLLVGFFGGHVFQAAQYLRGMETFMMDLLLNEKLARTLLEALTEANIRRFEHFADTFGKYVQVVEFQDDLGTQSQPFVRPELYRKVIKPYHQRLFEFARSKTDALLLLHTDGAVSDFIPDFIEMGIDVLNPVQVSAAGMDSARLKRDFGNDMSFWGGSCDSQSTLSFGTPQDVEDEVRRRLDDLAPGGGFVFAPIHNIQVGVPPENIISLFQSARKYGSY